MRKLIKSNQTLYLSLRKLKMFYFRKRFRLKNVSKTFFMGNKSLVSKDLIADDYSYIGPNCIIGPKVNIGRFTMLANNVSIIGGDHEFNDPSTPIIFSGRPELKETFIGEDVWIGAFSIIMMGVKIGNGAIIGAGSVVTKDIPAYSIFAGVPAKFIKMRFDNNGINKHTEMLANSEIDVKYCKDKLD